MSVMITGGTGFIGWHLARQLRENDVRVIALVRRTSNVDQLKSIGVELRYGDVTDPASLTPAMADVDTVYHLAGLTFAVRTADFDRVNRQGTANIAAACAQAQVERLIHVSSLAASGPATNGQPKTEEDAPCPVSAYGRSKLQAEVALRSIADRVPTTIVRPPIVVGEADRVTLAIFRLIARTRVHLVPGRTRNRFSVIHASDLARLLILAAENGQRLSSKPSQAGEGVYFADLGDHPTFGELGCMVGKAMNHRPLVLPVAGPVFRAICAGADLAAMAIGRPLRLSSDKAKEALAGSWICSQAKSVSHFGFDRVVAFEERLKQTALWYRQQGWL